MEQLESELLGTLERAETLIAKQQTKMKRLEEQLRNAFFWNATRTRGVGDAESVHPAGDRRRIALLGLGWVLRYGGHVGFALSVEDGGGACERRRQKRI